MSVVTKGQPNASIAFCACFCKPSRETVKAGNATASNRTADFPHAACMGLSLSREHHAIFVVLCHSILLFDPRREHSSSRLHISIAVARSGGQGWCFFSSAEGLSLTDVSTAAGSLAIGWLAAR